MKERIVTGWNFMRMLWLIMGIGIILQAVAERNFLMLLPGLYFAFAALGNIGCFAGSCTTTPQTNNGKKTQAITEIEFEEIQAKV
jgi:hypothetical protein